MLLVFGLGRLAQAEDGLFRGAFVLESQNVVALWEPFDGLLVNILGKVANEAFSLSFGLIFRAYGFLVQGQPTSRFSVNRLQEIAIGSSFPSIPIGL